MEVVVMGAGVAGLGAALAFAREGHRVTLLERDPAPRVDPSGDVFDTWTRPGVGHFRQPHNFLGLARKVLVERAPDVLEDLRRMGAEEIDQARLLPGAERDDGDREFVSIACRRPVFEAALRRAVTAEVNVDIRVGTRVAGLIVSPNGHGPVRVTGATTEAADVRADLVVDALGRSSSVRDWIAAAGGETAPELSEECGLLYFSRHFRLRDGVERPSVPSLLGGPRGEYPYIGFSVFLGDDRTFAVVVMVPPWDAELRAVRRDDAYMRALLAFPPLAPWVQGDVSEPISPVLPMGQVRNTYRDYAPHGRPVASGVAAVGDALCHTNPTFAYGASLALHQAFTLADIAREATDDVDLVTRYYATVADDAERRFRSVASEDRERMRRWRGEAVDVTDRRSSPAMFLRTVVYPAALRDADVFRAVARRVNLLAVSDELERDEALIERAQQIARQPGGTPPPAAPSREELLALIA